MGFLFIEPSDNNETTHIFPAYYGRDKELHTFNDSDFNNMEEVKNIYINRAKIKDIDSDENESICNLITINDIGEEIIDINYCKTRIDARNYAANKQNSGYNVCGNCVRRLYKNEDDN